MADQTIAFTFRNTARGFPRIEFNDIYGDRCSLQASSLATIQAIWFGINQGKIDRITNQVISPRMHLSRDLVAALLPTLQHFVESGDLLPPGHPSLGPPC